MTNFIPIRYNPIWAILYIFIGLACTFIFIFASVYLNDITISVYILASLPPIYIGIILFRTPYAKITNQSIIVYGLFGQKKQTYFFLSKSQPIYKKGRFYIVKKGEFKKLKMNKWFVNKNDWERVIEFFDKDYSKKIIKHLITD